MGTKVSIRDVAAAAGVSVTTVSHVLNNKSGTRVSPETRERVESAARQLGYAANGLARGLRLQRSHTLGLLSDVIATTPHAGRIILGAQETASARGWVLMLLTTGGDPQVERREIQALAQHRVDGVLYATMYHRVVEVPDELRPMPVVLLDAASTDPSLPSVVPDETGGGRVAVRELLNRGHRRIGFVTNVDDIPATRGRLLGYQEALREAAVPYRPDLVLDEVSDTLGGYRAARELLTRPQRPTALFCFNDRMAMGAYRAAAELGLRIPDDLSVIGFDNQELIADGLHPGLTTVALPHYEMGAWAVETMVELLNQPKGARRRAARQVVMPCPLVARASVAAPPG
ncbi:LacI family DNA-binding transcriptional regulator [Micromonospora mirobrigensis]|uniref:Transcriptional regulator, LacI family n=1 Tax=Micromonospora mirobrigensis TaxID=262898 RepID=A0A1C4YTU5_9ACTN|nr:LacI family DNA-binding transcriptional regulator [Micromonospora mirobrigensis]SCF24202.1 transcriptional regulator, LacI family [Micromonospora mirobrigensis]